MAYEAVGQDLLSILKMFTSPRMGPFENTNATTKMPPGSDEARAASDPSRYGGGQGPGGGNLPPGFPSPVARRVVNPEDPETTGSVTSPVGRPPVAVPGQVAQAAPAGNSLTDFMNADPAYQAYMAQVRRQQAEARQQQAIENVFGGLADVARARGATVSGGEQTPVKVPTGDLPLDVIQGFQKRKEGLEAEAAELKRIDKIVADPRMKGISKEQLLSMRANNKDAYAKFIQDWISGETETHFDPVTHDILSRPKYGPADRPYERIANIPGREKADADLNKTKADANKVIQETAQGRIDIKDLKSPENLERISKVVKIPPEILAGMDANGIIKALTDVSTSGASGVQAARTQIAGKGVEAADAVIKTAKENLADRAARREVLARGEPVTGYPGADFEGAVRAFVSGGGDPREARTRMYLSLSAADVMKAGEGMKGSFSENDLKFLQMARGASRALSKPEMERLLALHDLVDRRHLNDAIVARSKGRAGLDQPDIDVEEAKAGPMQDHELKVIQAPLLRNALLGPGGQKYLETVYGKEIATEAMARASEIAAAKLGPEAVTFQSVPLQQLKDDADAYQAKMTAKYGDTADGAVKLIIAAREKAEARP